MPWRIPTDTPAIRTLKSATSIQPILAATAPASSNPYYHTSVRNRRGGNPPRGLGQVAGRCSDIRAPFFQNQCSACRTSIAIWWIGCSAWASLRYSSTFSPITTFIVNNARNINVSILSHFISGCSRVGQFPCPTTRLCPTWVDSYPHWPYLAWSVGAFLLHLHHSFL